MCKLNEDMRNEAAKTAEHNALVKVAVNCIKEGIYNIETIIKLTGLPFDEIMSLVEQYKTTTA